MLSGLGYGDVRLRAEKRGEAAEAKAQGVAVNAGQIIAALAFAVDSLDVRVTALERENVALRRQARQRRPVVDTVWQYPAELYGPRERPPGFLSRLLGRD